MEFLQTLGLDTVNAVVITTATSFTGVVVTTYTKRWLDSKNKRKKNHHVRQDNVGGSEKE